MTGFLFVEHEGWKGFVLKNHRWLAKYPELHPGRFARYTVPGCQDLFVPAPVLQILVGDMLLLIICIYLIRSHPLLGAFARRHSIVATCTGANAVLGGVGGKACWVYRLLGKKMPESNGWVRFSRPANLQASQIGTCILKAFLKHRPWRIAVGNLFLNSPWSIPFLFRGGWINCRFFQGLHAPICCKKNAYCTYTFRSQ